MGLQTEAAFPPEAGRGGRLQAGPGAEGAVGGECTVVGRPVPGVARWKLGRGDRDPHRPPRLRVVLEVHWDVRVVGLALRVSSRDLGTSWP